MKTNKSPKILNLNVFTILAFLLFFLSCNKTETLQTMTLEEMYPLKIGKFITYRLDSMVFVNAGKTLETHKYQVKHVIEQEVKDNQNRPSWRVVTYLNDSTASGPWISNGTYIVTPVDKQLEIFENNLRVIKIHLPAREGYKWNGNSYLPNRPYNPDFPISIDGNMSLWEFNYETINNSEKINNVTLPDVTTISHIDVSENVPLKSDTVFASRELSLEKYAKNIGLVYREFELWENQPRPRTSGAPPNVITSYDPVRIGFGVKMWMINKN